MGSTSIVDQLWSKAGCVYISRRFGLIPLFFEIIMLLKENTDIWTIYDIVNLDNQRKYVNQENRAKNKIDKNNVIEQLSQPLLEINLRFNH